MEPKYKEYYEKAEEHAGTQKGLLNPVEGLERARYILAAYLAGVYGSATNTKPHVLDIGCGYGDLSAYLGEEIKYTGVDTIPWIFEAAKNKYPEKDFQMVDMESNTWVISGGPASVAVMLGVLPTVTPKTLSVLAQSVREAVTDYVVLTFYPPGENTTNSFETQTVEQLVEAFGAVSHREGTLPGDKFHVLELYLRSKP